MAEFSEVMRHWRRMCVACETKYGDNSCIECPLHGCTAIYDSDGTEDNADIERKVMQWAAEHPEMVYPTWYEWLRGIGVLGTAAIDNGYTSEMLCTTHIPADIAQKLGIEPEER